MYPIKLWHVAIVLVISFVAHASQTSTYKYTCTNSACKDRGRVIEYEELTPTVRYCSTCGKQLVVKR